MSSSPQVSRRSDDVEGQGWGLVRTGQVTNTKMSFYSRAASTERDIPDTPGQRRRLVSPTSRPNVKTGDVALNIRSDIPILVLVMTECCRGWTQKVKEHEVKMVRQSPIPFIKSERDSPSPPLPPPPSRETLRSLGLSSSSYYPEDNKFEWTDL